MNDSLCVGKEPPDVFDFYQVKGKSIGRRRCLPSSDLFFPLFFFSPGSVQVRQPMLIAEVQKGTTTEM